MADAAASTAAPSTPTYSSLEAVEVPTAVAPGGSFGVHLWATSKGQRVRKPKMLWRASGAAPIIVPRSVHDASGARHALRPSAVLRARLDTSRARVVDNVIAHATGVRNWSSEEELPYEAHADDIGWCAGPVGGTAGRCLPTFTGPAMGVRDPALTSGSTARSIMHVAQFSRTYLDKICIYARQHVLHWRNAHSRRDGIERSFDPATLVGAHVELWIAANVLIAQLNTAVPAKKLWDATSNLYNIDLDSALPFIHYQYLNRHLSFGEYGTEGGQEDGAATDDTALGLGSSGARGFDRYQKRRAISDIARQLSSRAFNPGQHVGFDDLIRPTRHWDGRRVRHKAAVHTGRACERPAW